MSSGDYLILEGSETSWNSPRKIWNDKKVSDLLDTIPFEMIERYVRKVKIKSIENDLKKENQ